MAHKFPEEKNPLSAALKGMLQIEGGRIEKIIFRSRQRYPVTTNLYIPEGAENAPAVIFVGGTVLEGKAHVNVQLVAQKLLRCGFVVLVMDSAGQGERGLLTDVTGAEGIAEHPELERRLLASQMKLVDESFTDWALWDVIRAIDFLESRSEADNARICVIEGEGSCICSLLDEVDQRPFLTVSEKFEKTPGAAAAFFCRLFNMENAAGNDENIKLFTAEDLRCTPYGTIVRLDGQIMLFDFIRANADEYRVRRPKLEPACLKEKIRIMLNLDPEVKVSTSCSGAAAQEQRKIIKVSFAGTAQSAEMRAECDECAEITVSDAENGTKMILQKINDLCCSNIEISAAGYASIPALFAALLSEDVKSITLTDAPESFDAMLRHRIISVPASVMPQGILQFTDIPELVELVGAKIIK